MASHPEVGALRAGELGPAAAILARAFRDDPLNRAVIGSSSPRRRLRTNAAGLRCQIGMALRHGEALAAREGGQLVGVLLAASPGGWPLPVPPLSDRLRAWLVQGPRVVRRWAEVAEAVGRHHPLHRHWYLAVLGVDPSHAGRGLGRALLARLLARADADGVPTYLETSAEANLGFYRRAGFAIVGELELHRVRAWCLERAPRTGASSWMT